MTLSTALAARIRRLVPMLASTHDGEAIATKNAIGRELAGGGSDWHGLAASIVGVDPPKESAPAPPNMPYAFGDLSRAVRDLDGGQLSHRERVFVGQMCARGFTYRATDRQIAWLQNLYNRLARRAAA